MPNDKGTNVFSEIGKFFKEKDATSAMNAIMDMMDALSLSEKRLFGIKSRCNCKLTQLQLLGLLMLFPCFMIRNAYNYASSSLFGVYSSKPSFQIPPTDIHGKYPQCRIFRKFQTKSLVMSK